MMCCRLISFLVFFIFCSYSEVSYSALKRLNESGSLETEMHIDFLYQDKIHKRRYAAYSILRVENDDLSNLDILPDTENTERFMHKRDTGIIDIDNTSNNDKSIIDTIFIAYGFTYDGKMSKKYETIYFQDQSSYSGSTASINIPINSTFLLGKYINHDYKSSRRANYIPKFWYGEGFYNTCSNEQKHPNDQSKNIVFVNRGVRIYAPNDDINYKSPWSSICVGYSFKNPSTADQFNAKFETARYDINQFPDAIICHSSNYNQVVADNPDNINMYNPSTVAYASVLLGCGAYKNFVNRGAILMIRDSEDKNVLCSAIYFAEKINKMDNLINVKNAYIGVQRQDGTPLGENDFAIINSRKKYYGRTSVYNYGVIEGSIYSYLDYDAGHDSSLYLDNYGTVTATHINIQGAGWLRSVLLNIKGTIIANTFTVVSCENYDGATLTIGEFNGSNISNSGTLTITSDDRDYQKKLTVGESGILIQNTLCFDNSGIIDFKSLISKNFYIDDTKKSGRVSGHNLTFSHRFETDFLHLTGNKHEYKFANTGNAYIHKGIYMPFENHQNLYLGDEVSYTHTLTNNGNIYADDTFYLHASLFEAGVNSLLKVGTLDTSHSDTFTNKAQTTVIANAIKILQNDFINEGEAHLTNIIGDYYNASIRNNDTLYSLYSSHAVIYNTGTFYIDSKQASKLNNSLYFDVIINKGGNINLILEDLQTPTNINYTLLNCDTLVLIKHSKITLEQSSSYKEITLLKTINRPQHINIVKANSLMGTDTENRIFMKDLLVYVKDVTNKKYILDIQEISRTYTRDLTSVISATIEWKAVTDPSKFPKLDTNNCYNVQDIKKYFGTVMYGLEIIEQDQRDIFYIKQKKAFIGKKKSSAMPAIITIDSSKASPSFPAICIELSQKTNIDQLTTEATIDGTIDRNSKNKVDNIAVKVCPQKTITDKINCVAGSLRYHELMPSLKLTGAIVNNALIKGKYGINIALPIHGKITNNDRIIGTDAALKFDGPANIVLGDIENHLLIKSDNHAILMDAHPAYYTEFKEYIRTKKQDDKLSFTNNGTIDGKLITSGNIYLQNKSVIVAASSEHIYGTFRIDNQASSNINITQIKSDKNATFKINNFGIINSDDMQINELHNKTSGIITVNNLSVSTLDNQGSMTITQAQLNKMTFNNMEGGTLTINTLSQISGLVENTNNSYCQIGTITTLTKDGNKKTTYTNDNNSTLKISNVFNNKLAFINNKNSCVDIQAKSSFKQYDSNSAVIKILIPDNPADITVPLLKINTNATFHSIANKSSRLALYAKKPVILPYEVTVTLLEADNISGGDIINTTNAMQNLLAGVDMHPGTKTNANILIISKPVLNTTTQPHKLQAQIRWYNIKGGFPPIDSFNTYNMEDAVLSSLPFIYGLKVIEYDTNKNWYIAARGVRLGKTFENDTSKNIYASANAKHKQAVKIETDVKLSIKNILIQGNIDASKYITSSKQQHYTSNKCALVISGKELTITNGFDIEANSSLISSLSSTINPLKAYKTAALLLESTINTNINNHGKILGITGFAIKGNTNLLHGAINNYNEIRVTGNIIACLATTRSLITNRNLTFYNKKNATAIGGGCLLSGNNISIVNEGLLQTTTLTHINAISKLENKPSAIFNLTNNINTSSTLTMINYGMVHATNTLSLTSLQNISQAKLTAHKLNLINASSNSGTIHTHKLHHDNMFHNQPNSHLIVLGTSGLSLQDSNFINQGRITVNYSTHIIDKFTNKGDIYTNSLTYNNHKLLNKKVIHVIGTSELSLKPNLENTGNITVNATLSVIDNYNSKGNWIVGGFHTIAKFTNNTGYMLKIVTNDLVINKQTDIINQGTLEVPHSIKLNSNFANSGVLTAGTLEGKGVNRPEFNNNGNNYAHINVVKNIIINNNASLLIKEKIQGITTINYNKTMLDDTVSQSGELFANNIESNGTFIIKGKANITDTLTTDLLEIVKTNTIGLQVKNLIVYNNMNNYSITKVNNIKLPTLTNQYGKLSITGASGLYLDQKINNMGEINIDHGLHLAQEFNLTGTITANYLTTATDCHCILDPKSNVTLANIGEVTTSNQIIKIINFGKLNLKNDTSAVKLRGDIAVHKDENYSNDGKVIIHNNVHQFGLLQLGNISAPRTVTYTLQPNATTQFTEPIQQPINFINSGNLYLKCDSNFNSQRYHNSGSITVNVTDFINSSTSTTLLTLNNLILNKQKNNNKIILIPDLHNAILPAFYIGKTQTLYLLRINNNIYYLDQNNQRRIIDRIQNDINNYINLTSELVHSISFSIDSKIRSEPISPTQSVQSGARYLSILISPTLTYKFADKSMGFNKQTLHAKELGTYCIKKDTTTWGVCWRHNKSGNIIYDNNLIINPYYALTEYKLVSFNNKVLSIGSVKPATIYAEAYIFPAFIIGSKIDSANPPPVKQLTLNDINFSNITITGREVIFPRRNIINRDGILINGNNSIKIVNKINIDRNTSFISGYDRHALHIASKIIGTIVNNGNIGDKSSGYGIYISSAVSLTIDNNNKIMGKLAALSLEPASYWQQQKTNLVINNNKDITGNILVSASAQQVTSTINNIGTINSDKIIAYSGNLIINNTNSGKIITNEMSATNISNHSTLKIKTVKKFIVDNNIINTGDLYITNMVLANDFTCSGSIIATNLNGQGYKIENSDTNKFSNIQDVTIKQCKLLEMSNNILGNVIAFATVTLANNLEVNNNAEFKLYKPIIYNKHDVYNNGVVTSLADKFILTKNFINEVHASLNVANILQTQGSVTIAGNVFANILQPITTGTITVSTDGSLQLKAIDNSSKTSRLDFYTHGTLELTNQTAFATIYGNINIQHDEKSRGLLIGENLKQDKGILTIDDIQTSQNSTIEVTNTKFTKVINNNQLAINNKHNVQVPTGSKLGSYTSLTKSELVIPINEYFHLIDYPLIYFTDDVYLNNNSKITIISDKIFLPIQHRTRVTIITSDNRLRKSKNTLLQRHDVQNIFSNLRSVNNRIIKAVKDSISIEDNGYSLVADLELIPDSILPAGMYQVEIPLYKNLIGKCQPQDTNITGVSLANLTAQNQLAIAPYFMAVYSKLISFVNNKLTIGATISNNPIKIEDYTSPAVIISIQATPSNVTTNNLVSIDSINIVNQDINGYQFAYTNNIGGEANQDGLLITRNNNTRQLQTTINIDKDSIISAGEKNHALHIAIPIIGSINNSGILGQPNTGYGINFNQLLAGTLTNNNTIQGKIAAINIELDTTTANKLTIINNKAVKGNILIINNNKNFLKTPAISLHNKKHAYILADTVTTSSIIPLDVTNDDGAVIRVKNLSINNAVNEGIISVAESDIKYNSFDNKGKLNIQNLTINSLATFKNSGVINAAGVITLNKNFVAGGTITANKLLGNNHYLTKLSHGEFRVLDNIKVAADYISVADSINNIVIIDNTLTTVDSVTQRGDLNAKNIIGSGELVITGNTKVKNELTLNSLRVNMLGSLVADTIKYEQILENQGVITVTNLENNSNKLIQAGTLKILGKNPVNLDSMFVQSGTTEIPNAPVNIVEDLELKGYLLVKELLAAYSSIKNFVKVDIAANSTVLVNGNIGDANKLDKKIIFVNDGNLVINGNNSINGNIEIYKNNYNIQLPATGILEIRGNITQQGMLTIGEFAANNYNSITINSNSTVKCNNKMQQNKISIVNHATLDLVQGTQLNNYEGKAGSCLVLELSNIDEIQSFNHPALHLDKKAIFANNTIVKLKPQKQTKMISSFINNKIYLINATQGIVDSSNNTITNVSKLVETIHVDTVLLKVTNVTLANNNKSLVADLHRSWIYPDPNMKTANMQLLNKLLGECQPQDKLLGATCWNYNVNQAKNMLLTPENLGLDKIAVYDQDNLEFIIDSKYEYEYKTIYATNNPAISIGTTISSKNLAVNPADNINLTKIQLNNLNINAAKINPLLNSVTKTNDEDGIVITGFNPIVLYKEMSIADTVKIVAGANHHALHLAVPIIGTINNNGSLGDSQSGYGVAITASLKGELNNFNSIAGNKAAIIINPMASAKGKSLIINNKGTINGSIIATANDDIVYSMIKLNNFNTIKAKDINCSDNLELYLINRLTGMINVNNLNIKNIDNRGEITAYTFNSYSLVNTGSITVTNSMTLYKDIINKGRILTKILDGKGYSLNNSKGKLTVGMLKNITIYNDTAINLQEKIIDFVYILDKVNIGKKHNVVIEHNSTLQAGNVNIAGNLTNNGELIILNNNLDVSGTLLNKKNALINTKNNNILLSGILTNNGTIKANNIIGAKCTVINSKDAILNLRNLGNNDKDVILIKNQGDLNLNITLKNDGVIAGNIYIEKNNTTKHNGELNIYTNVYQQKLSNLYLGKINCINKSNFSISKQATTTITNWINQPSLSIDNKGNVILQPLSVFNKYTGYDISKLVIDISNNLSSYGKTSLITIEDNLDFFGNAKLLIDFSESIQHSLLLKKTKINLLKVKNYITYNFHDITKKEIHNIIDFNQHNLIISLDENDIHINKDDRNDYTLVSINIIATSKPPKGFGYGYILLDKNILGECQPKNEKIPCFFYKDNLDVTTVPVACNLAIYPSFQLLTPAQVTIKHGNIQIGSPTNNIKATIVDETGYHPALILATSVISATITDYTHNILTFNKIDIANVDITRKYSYEPTDEFIAQDGLLITGENVLKIHQGIKIGTNCNILAGNNKHALHLAAAIVANIDNLGVIGDEVASSGIMINNSFQGEINNFGHIAGSNTAINIDVDVSKLYSMKNMIINNNKQINGSIIANVKNTPLMQDIIQSATSTALNHATITLINYGKIESCYKLIDHDLLSIKVINKDGNINAKNISVKLIDNQAIIQNVATLDLVNNNFINNNLATLKLINGSTITINNNNFVNNGKVHAFNVALNNNFNNKGFMAVANLLNGNFNNFDSNDEATLECNKLTDIHLTGNTERVTIKAKVSGKVIVDDVLLLRQNIIQSGTLTAKEIVADNQFQNNSFTINGIVNTTNCKLAHLHNNISGYLQTDNLILQQNSNNQGEINTNTLNILPNAKFINSGTINITNNFEINHNITNSGYINAEKNTSISANCTNYGTLITHIINSATKSDLLNTGTIEVGNLGDDNSDIKIINNGEVIIDDNANIKGNITITNKAIKMLGNAQLASGSLLTQGLSAINNSDFTIAKDSSAVFTATLNQEKLAIINQATVEFTNYNKINNYDGRNAHLLLRIEQELTSIKQPLISCKQHAIFNSTSKISLIPSVVLNYTSEDTLTVVYASKGIKYDIAQSTELTKLNNISQKDLEPLFRELKDGAVFFKIYNPQITEDSKKLICQVRLLYNLDKYGHNMSYTSVSLDKKLIGKCIDTTSSVFAIAWECNKINDKVSTNNLAVSPLNLILQDNIISYNCNKKKLLISGHNKDGSAKEITAKNNIATAIISSAIEINNNVINAEETSALEINGIEIDNINIIGVNYQNYNEAVDGLLITGKYPLKINDGANFHIGNKAVIKAKANKHALHMAVKLIGNINNHGTIGDDDSENAIYISQPIATTLTNYNAILAANTAIKVCASNDWELNNENFTLTNNGNITGSLLFTTANSLTQVNYITKINNNKLITSNSIIADNGMVLDITNKGVINANEAEINSLINFGVINITDKNGIIINNQVINHHIINANYCNLNNNKLINTTSASATIQHLANAKIENDGILLVKNKLSGNILVNNTLTLGESVEQTGTLKTHDIVTNNTNLNVSGHIEVNGNIALQQLNNLVTGRIVSNNCLSIENFTENKGFIDVASLKYKNLFTNKKTGKLYIKEGKLIINNSNFINLGCINSKNLILSGSFTNSGKITAYNFLGNNNILLTTKDSQIKANTLENITILGTSDITVANIIAGKVKINTQLNLSGNVTNIGALELYSLNTNDYKFTIANNGSLTVSSSQGLTVSATNLANYGYFKVMHKLNLLDTFTNNGTLEAYMLNGNKHNFINNKNTTIDIIKDSKIINNGSILVNNCILGNNIIYSEVNIGDRVLQSGSFTCNSIATTNNSEFIIDNNSSANIAYLNNKKLDIINHGNLLVNGVINVNSYTAQGGILTIQVDSKLANAPFLRAKEAIEINTYLGKQALIVISATEGVIGFKKKKVLIATAESLYANNKIMLDTDLSYLLAVKKIASSSLLLNINNVGIEKNALQQAIYADLEYINVADIKQLQSVPVAIRRFANILQNAKILQLEPYILNLIREEIKHYRLHPDTENEVIYFLQDKHPRTYKVLVDKMRDKILDSVDVAKQDSTYQEIIKLINAYLDKFYHRQTINNKPISLTASAQKPIVDGVITNNILYISNKVIQNNNVTVDKIIANSKSEFYITNNSTAKINNFNSENIDLVNSGLLAVQDLLQANNYTSWGGSLLINLTNLNNIPIIFVKNDVNFNDAYGSKSQLILTSNKFNNAGVVKKDIVIMQANTIKLNNEILQTADLNNLLAMQKSDSILLQLVNPKIRAIHNYKQIIVDLSWIEASKLLLTDNKPISLAKLADLLQATKITKQQTNITGDIYKNKLNITNDVLQTGKLIAKQLISNTDSTFTINDNSQANIDIIHAPHINIVNNGTLNTSPGININSYKANSGSLIFNISNISNITDKPFLQTKNNIEFCSNNNTLPAIILQYSASTINQDTHTVTLLKAKKILLDGDDLLEADINDLVKYQKVASSSILCKLSNISITRSTDNEAIQAKLAIIDIADIASIDNRPISVKQLANIMQKSTLPNSNNNILSFIEQQITQGNMPREISNIYQKISSKQAIINPKQQQILTNIEYSTKNDNNNLSATINELLPDNSCNNLQSIFNTFKQSLLSINTHNASKAKFNFLANNYFNLHETKSLVTPLWFSIKKNNYRANNTKNYFNAVTNSEVYSMGLEKNYNKIKVGYLLNYGVATTANLNINNYDKNINNQVTSIVSAIYTNYNIKSVSYSAGILLAKNQHDCSNFNQLLGESYHTKYDTITTSAFCNLASSNKINNLAFRFDSGIYFMNVKFPEYNVSSFELHRSYSRRVISWYTAVTFAYNYNKSTKVNLSINYSHDFNINQNNYINIILLDNNFIVKQKAINYKELNLDANIDIKLTNNSTIIFSLNDSLSSNGNNYKIKMQYNYKM